MTATTTDAGDTIVDDTRSKARVLADVRSTAKMIQRVEAKRDDLYARRAELFHEARTIEDRATYAALADAAGVSETIVSNTIKKGGADV